MLLNKNAFTLIEVLVAVAISTIIGLGIVTMLSESYKHDRILNIKQLARDMRDDVRFMMGSTRNCAIVSAGSTDVSSTFIIPFTKDSEGGIPASFRQPVKLARSSYFALEQGMSFSYGKIIIDRVEIAPYLSREDSTTGTFVTTGSSKMGYFPVAEDVSVGSNTYFIGEVDIVYHSVTEGTGTPQSKVSPFVAVFALDGTHDNITECRLMQSIADSSQQCSNIQGATWDVTSLKCNLPVNNPDTLSNSGDGNLSRFEAGCVTKNYGTENGSSCP